LIREDEYFLPAINITKMAQVDDFGIESAQNCGYIRSMDQPELPCDLDDLWEILIAFRSKIPGHLTDDVPLPEAMAEPLWKALELVDGVVEQLRKTCGFQQTGTTVFAPVLGKWQGPIAAFLGKEHEQHAKDPEES
jgi:hypothetical protein